MQVGFWSIEAPYMRHGRGKNSWIFFFQYRKLAQTVLLRWPNHHTQSANSTRRRQETPQLALKTATTPPILAWVHGVWVLTSWVAMCECCREFAAVPPPPHHPEKSCSTTEENFLPPREKLNKGFPGNASWAWTWG